MRVTLELLTEQRFAQAAAIDRSDVPEAFVDPAETFMELHRYGLEHGCIGYTFLVLAEGRCVGMLLLGEAIPWETDPPEMAREPFYRLMGFVIDRHWRGQGIGAAALEMAVERVYSDFGVRPIALGVHRDNHGAAAFYVRHRFRPTDAMEGADRYYLRYPEGWEV